MFPRLGRGLLVATILGGCGFSESDARPRVDRALRETPRLVQVAFGLAELPVNTFPTTGRYPQWVREVNVQRFDFHRVADSIYEARATVDVVRGPDLPAAARQRAVLDITVDFDVQVTPPPIFFLPPDRSLMPSTWRLHAVNGAPSTETGAVGDYRE